jgi:hypothetical protein
MNSQLQCKTKQNKKQNKEKKRKKKGERKIEKLTLMCNPRINHQVFMLRIPIF